MLFGLILLCSAGDTSYVDAKFYIEPTQNSTHDGFHKVSDEYPLLLEFNIGNLDADEKVTMYFGEVENAKITPTITWSKNNPRGYVEQCTPYDDPIIRLEKEVEHMSMAILITSSTIRLLNQGKIVQEVNEETATKACVNTWWNNKRYVLRYLKLSDGTNVTYSKNLRAMCPPSHPISYNHGMLCCMQSVVPMPVFSPYLRAMDEPESCPDDVIHYGSPVQCCPIEKRYPCKNPPCYDYPYQGIPEGTKTRTCRDPGWDPFGLLYRGDVQTSISRQPCMPWLETEQSTGDHAYNEALGILGRECRNPDQDKLGPWCYAEKLIDDTVVITKDRCVIPECTEITNIGPQIPILATRPPPPLFTVPPDNALRLYNPYSPSQAMIGYYGPEKAIDGDFLTFLLTEPLFGQFTATLSPDSSRVYIISKIVVYTVNVLLPNDDVAPYFTDQLLVGVGPEDDGNYQYQPCEGMINHPYRERYVFDCNGGVATKIFIAPPTNSFAPLALREVEVYGREADKHPGFVSEGKPSFRVDTEKLLKMQIDDLNLSLVYDKKSQQVSSIELIN